MLPSAHGFSWRDGCVIAGIAFGCCIAVLIGLVIAYNVRHNRQVKLEKKLTRRAKDRAAITGVVQAQQHVETSHQDRRGGAEEGQKEDGHEKKKDGSSVTTSSSSATTATATTVVDTLATIANGGIVYDSSGDVRCADFSVPRGNNSGEAARDDDLSFSFDATGISETEIQEATALRYYQPHPGRGQIVHLSSRE